MVAQPVHRLRLVAGSLTALEAALKFSTPACAATLSARDQWEV